MTLLTVSFWSIPAAVLASAVIGFLWYAPFSFSPAWARGLRLSAEEMKRGPHPITWLVMLFSEACSALILVALRAMLGLSSWGEMLTLTCSLVLAVFALPTLMNSLFGRKNLKVWAIEAGGTLAMLAGQAIVVSLF